MVWAYMVDLLQALGHLHDHDLVHMDVKPENIFLWMDGICKLGDFGLMIDLAKGEGEGEMYLLIRKLVRLSALGEVVTSLILKSLDHLI